MCVLSLTIQLYSRYVDDGNIAVKYSKRNNLTKEKVIDITKREKEIMEKIKSIANSIHESISVKVDYPSNHTNNRLPILNTEMRIAEVDVNGTMKHQILYSYYEKEMSSKYLVHKYSAMSDQSKTNVLVNDLIRMMKNTSLRVNGEQKQRNVQRFYKYSVVLRAWEEMKELKFTTKQQKSSKKGLTSQRYIRI